MKKIRSSTQGTVRHYYAFTLLQSLAFFSAVPYGLAALVAWGIPEPKRGKTVSESKRYLEIAKRGLDYFRHHRKLKLMALDAALVATAAYFVIWLYQPLLISLEIPIAYFGWFHAGIIAVEMTVAANFGRLEKLFGSPEGYLKFTALATAVSFMIAAAWPNLATIILLLVFAGGLGLTRMEFVSAQINRFIPSDQRATVLSSVSMFRRFALVPLNPLVGALADHSLRGALFAVGFLPLGTFFLSTKKRRGSPPRRLLRHCDASKHRSG